MKRSIVALLAIMSSSCVPYPEDAPPPVSSRSAITNAGFAPLDAGANMLDSLHFTVRAYGGDETKLVSTTAEDCYNRIMMDTNLYSFMPSGLYQIVVYADHDEYKRKTSQPEWSGGVTLGNAIYTYEGPALSRTLAHEMTHLIFFEFMGRVNLDHRWVNEGLAVYEEQKAAGPGDLFSQVRSGLSHAPLPMDQMVSLAPATEAQYTVSLWYAESESLVRFMIDHGGHIGFAQFLGELQKGQTFDRAIAVGFPSVWRDLNDFYSAWQRNGQ